MRHLSFGLSDLFSGRFPLDRLCEFGSMRISGSIINFHG